MTANAMTMTGPASLRFTQSESKAVGFAGNILDVVRDNAPRIVGGLRLAGDLTTGVTLNPFMIGYALFAVTGRLIMMIWGTKANQRRLAAAHHGKAADGTLAKVMSPGQYPMESSAGFSIISEFFEVGYGISQFMAQKTGFTPVLVGAVAMCSYANILFGKEKKKEQRPAGAQESLTFAASKSKAVGFGGRIRQALKDNPVLVSSVVHIGLSIGMVVGSFLEPNLSAAYMVSAFFYLTSNILQALFVRKNEFNIEGAQDKPAEALTFEEKLAQMRQNENGGKTRP